MDTTTLWQNYCETADPAARDELLVANLSLVHHVARQMVRNVRQDVDFDEVISAGTIGLIHAVESFDPARGLAFSTYAAPRIRGAILDDLRRRDHVPRSVRRKQRELNKARDTLAGRLDRQPTDQELAEELGVAVEKVWRWQEEAEYASHVSMDEPAERPKGRGVTQGETLEDPTGKDNAEAQLNHLEEVALIREGILSLKEQERLVLSLYYFEELKLHEIASILGVTESRVSQIRSKAIANLRAYVGHLREGMCA
jgi:RNA polymerase sigma factor for flagellar operon FliA